jgi:hypothetical protein
MSLKSYENSRDRGQPIEAFEFIYGEGSGDAYRYTDCERPVSLSGNTYAPIPIRRADSVKSKGRPDGTDLKIEVPATSEIAGLFRGYPPRRVIFLRIYQSHVPNDTDPVLWTDELAFGLFWSGRVLEAARRPRGIVQLSCDTLGAGMKRPGLTRFYQRSCQHRLYGPYCNANKAAATETAVVDSVNGFTVGLPTGWNGARAINDFIGGLIEWTGPYGTETRLIVEPSANAVVLDTPATDLVATDSVDLILGCPHTLAACRDLHDNAPNFGGNPWIPRVNPVNKNNHT